MNNNKFCKKNICFCGLVLILSFFLLSGCGTTSCACENSHDYKKRKSEVSLLNSWKNSNFALQNDIYVFLT